MTLLKRLTDLEDDLLPRELVIGWLRETHAFPTMGDYARWLADQPDDAYPLIKMPHLACEGVRKRNKGKKEIDLCPQFLSVQRDVLFLVHLASQVNEAVIGEQKALTERGRALRESFRHLLFRMRVSDHLEWLSFLLTRMLPYPVTEETCRTVVAAQAHAVEPWEELGSESEDWLEAQLTREGRRPLPGGAYCQQRFEVNPSPAV